MNSRIRVRVTDGASSAPPSATVRIACSRSRWRGVLEQEAAGAVAQRVEDVLVALERGQHDDPGAGQLGVGRRSGGSPRGRRCPGIRMSISTTSGRVRAAASTAARPSAASPATRKPSSLSSSARSPSRTRSWSSTRARRSLVRAPVTLRRDRGADLEGEPSGAGPAVSRPPSVCDPAAHAGDAEPVGVRPVGAGARSWLATRSRTAPGRYGPPRRPRAGAPSA